MWAGIVFLSLHFSVALIRVTRYVHDHIRMRSNTQTAPVSRERQMPQMKPRGLIPQSSLELTVSTRNLEGKVTIRQLAGRLHLMDTT